MPWLLKSCSRASHPQLPLDLPLVHDETAGPVEENHFRLIFELPGIEPVSLELLQERFRPAIGHVALALARLRTLLEYAQASAVSARRSVHDMHIHLMVRYASIGCVLHHRKAAFQRFL